MKKRTVNKRKGKNKQTLKQRGNFIDPLGGKLYELKCSLISGLNEEENDESSFGIRSHLATRDRKVLTV